MEDNARKQILLLIDTACCEECDSNRSVVTAKTLYLACCRILFLFTGFASGKSGGLEKLKWNWKLFNSGTNKVPIKRRRTCFKDTRTETLDKLYEELEAQLENSTKPTKYEVDEEAPCRVIYRALALALQDYDWDTPVLMSPLPRKRDRSKMKSTFDACLKEKMSNCIFIISERFCDIGALCGRGRTSRRSLKKSLKEDLFPPAVSAQLKSKNIRLVIVWKKGGKMEEEMVEKSIGELEGVVSGLGGSVIPLSSLLAPPLEPSINPSPCLDEFPDMEEQFYEVQRKPGRAVSLLPSEVISRSYMATKTVPPKSHHHLMLNSAGNVTILQLFPINDCCSIPLLEEGPVIFKSLGLISTLPVSHCSTAYTCTGLLASDSIQQMFSDRVLKNYITPDCNQTQMDEDTTQTESLAADQVESNEVSNIYQQKGTILAQVRQSSRLQTRGSPDFLQMAFPWRRKRKREQTEDSTDNEEQTDAASDGGLTEKAAVELEPVQEQTMSPTNSCNDGEGSVCQSVPEEAEGTAVDQLLSEEWLSAESNGPSEEFENLNLTLAKSRFLLVMSIYGCNGNCNRLAILQPLTPLTSSLSLVNPSYNEELILLLKQDSPSEVLSATSVKEPLSIQDTDVYLSLNSLLPSQSHDNEGSPGHLWSSLLLPTFPLIPKEHFSWQYLSDWSHLLPKYGIRHTTMEQLKECYSDLSLDSTAPSNTGKLLTRLKKLYSPNKVGGLITGDSATEQEEPVQPVQKPCSSENVVNFDEALTQFSTEYLQKISEPDPEINSLLSWTIKITDKLKSSCLSEEKELWLEFEDRVLLSDSSLKELYSSPNERRGEETRSTEYLLQVLLHFESSRHLDSALLPKMVERLVLLLRRLYLITTPARVGTILRDTILIMYTDTTPDLLRAVYSELMIPLPSCLESPGNESENRTEDDEVKSGEEEEEEVIPRLPRSLEGVFQSEEERQPKRSLSRKASFHRQISISRQPSQQSVSGSKMGKKVRRSLFDRSHSFSGERNKRRKSDEHRTKERKSSIPNVVVKETPLKKQVDNYRKFKLQRLRSKSGIDNAHKEDVSVIEESPRRSFYPQIRNEESPTGQSKSIVFKTPPSKLLSPKVPMLLANKTLSAAALQSLLEGDFSSPHGSATPSNSQKSSCNVQQGATPSPDLFSATPPNNRTPSNNQRATQYFRFGDKESPLGSPKIILKKISSCELLRTPPIRPRVKCDQMNLSDTEKTPKHNCKSHDNYVLSHDTPTGSAVSTPTHNHSTPSNYSPASSSATPVRSILKTPLKSSTEKKNVTFSYSKLEADDTIDSASMAAFALSTPTKTDSIDFSKCLSKLHES